MKTKLMLMAGLLAVTFHVAGQVPVQRIGTSAAQPAATGDAAADADWAAVMKIYGEQPQQPRAEMGARALMEWTDKHFQRYGDAVMNFVAKHPADVRRWEGIVQMGFTPPMYIKGFKPEFDASPGTRNLIVDEQAQAKFKARQMKLDAEVLEAADSNTRQRTGALGWMLTEARIKARDEGKPIDLSELQATVDRVVAKYPDERGATVANAYLVALQTAAPDEAKAYAKKIENSPVAASINEMRQKAQKAADDAQKEMMVRAADIGTIKFTAADGREVDLAKLRGKVVLIDFWATWCGPCIAEMPNVIANYKQYHEKGFEIVGISLENSGVTDKDAADAKDKKLAAAKKKMLDFTKKNEMPWPQYFDGKYWENDLGRKYNIRAIPAMFLLDMEGKVVSTRARGPKLEEELKRLLAL